MINIYGYGVNNIHRIKNYGYGLNNKKQIINNHLIMVYKKNR